MIDLAAVAANIAALPGWEVVELGSDWLIVQNMFGSVSIEAAGGSSADWCGPTDGLLPVLAIVKEARDE